MILAIDFRDVLYQVKEFLSITNLTEIFFSLIMNRWILHCCFGQILFLQFLIWSHDLFSKYLIWWITLIDYSLESRSLLWRRHWTYYKWSLFSHWPVHKELLLGSIQEPDGVPEGKAIKAQRPLQDCDHLRTSLASNKAQKLPFK